MRVMFTTTSDRSLFRHLVPLAWALRTAGHEVCFAVQPGFVDEVTEAGLTAVPVGSDRNFFRVGRLRPEWMETIRKDLPSPYDTADPSVARADWSAMVQGYRECLEWHRLDNASVIPGLVGFAREWRPDLVLWEPLAFAGGIAARACGAAHGRLLWTVDVFGISRQLFTGLSGQRPEGERADPLGDWLAGYARKYGFDFSEDLITGQFTVDPFPPPLRMDTGSSRVPMRFVPYGGAAVVPPWLQERPKRPRVAVTLGITAVDRFGGYTSDMRDLLSGLSGLDIEVVATMPDAERARLGRIPDNARVLPYVPLAVLAPTCDAVVNHAGPGTLLTMAAHGVPQVLLPWEFDAPLLSSLAGEQGGSLVLRPDMADGAVVRDAVVRLLDEPYPRQRAGELAAQMADTPSPGALAASLEDIAVRHRPS